MKLCPLGNAVDGRERERERGQKHQMRLLTICFKHLDLAIAIWCVTFIFKIAVELRYWPCVHILNPNKIRHKA
jgi:hypothetical protein